MRPPRLQSVVARLLPLLGAGLIAIAFLAQCTTRSSRVSTDDIALSVRASEKTLYLAHGVRSGILFVSVDNMYTEDIAVDIWVDVLPGLHFTKGFTERVSEDGRQATQAGMVLPPSERRVVEFAYELDAEAEPGAYSIQANAFSSSDDQATVTVQVEVARLP